MFFQDFRSAFRQYRDGEMTSDHLVSELGKNRLGRTPNPMRICYAIEIANTIMPFVMAMMKPPMVWNPLPLPPFCTTPVPTAAVGDSEARLIVRAVIEGLTD